MDDSSNKSLDDFTTERQHIIRVATNYPTLTVEGWERAAVNNEREQLRRLTFSGRRTRLLDPTSLAQFRIAVRFLASLPRRFAAQRGCTGETVQQHLDEAVGPGVLLAAALSLGIPCRQAAGQGAAAYELGVALPPLPVPGSE